MVMKNLSKSAKIIMSVIIVVAALSPVIANAAFGDELVQPDLYGTFWGLIPPIVAITLALITKEVYSSLVIGVIVGGIFASNFSFEGTIKQVFSGGMIKVLSDTSNVGIIIFLVILGCMVSLMNRTGGSAAFGRWAETHIKSRVGAQIVAVVLGCLIFIDDYFNCLTVGSVMRPVTDKHRVSRAKLAYIIDSTAAPICIIAPISSWAAAVSGFVEGEDGLSIFVRAIPYNYYALLTIVMMFVIIIGKFDYGPMKLHEKNAIEKGDLFTSGKPKEEDVNEKFSEKGRVIDMLFPIIVLIVSCIIGMIYTGGFFEGVGIVEAFSNSSAAFGLAVGSFCALIISIIFYLCRRVLSFKECMEALPEGFKSMVPAILILTFAWSLKALTDTMGANVFVAGVMSNAASSFLAFLPVIIFFVGMGLAFATGTSWGTFGILIPIVVAVFQNTDPQMMIISISACMAGAVCGDHCSPISDTTIMASAGSRSNHINHVSTQLPYAITVAVVSGAAYVIAGFIKNPVITLAIAVAMLIAVLMIIRKVASGKNVSGE